MAGSLYLGSQKVCPVLLVGSSSAPRIIFKLADDITEVSQNKTRAFQNLFNRREDFSFDVDLNNLEEVSGIDSFNHFMADCYNSTVKAKNIRVLSGKNAMYAAFYSYGQPVEVDIDFTKFEEVSGDWAFGEALVGCSLKNPEVRFENLSDITGDRALIACFSETNVSSIYFNSLTAQSFGNYTNQLVDIIYYANGCTLHFPSNLSSFVPTLSGYPNFGGTNTVLLYDLPATE